MNRRGFLKATAASALSCAILVACAEEYVTLRYKLRIVVEIDGLQYEGVSVVETEFVDRRNSPLLLPDAPEVVANSRGEAVIVDLREHGLLFGLLVPPDFMAGFNGVQPQSALSRCVQPARRSDRQNFLKNIQALQGECELRESDRPSLVRFRDIRDPSSAELVEPTRFAEVYGPNAAFIRATISVTSDPVTEPAIDRMLPWLSSSGARLATNLIES